MDAQPTLAYFICPSSISLPNWHDWGEKWQWLLYLLPIFRVIFGKAQQQYQSFRVWVVIVSRIGLLHERTGLGTGFDVVTNHLSTHTTKPSFI